MGQFRIARGMGFLILLLSMVSACKQISDSMPVVFSDAVPACITIGQSWVSPTDGMELVCIPEGNFLMGAQENDSKADSDEFPQHQVYLNAFWIDRTEVTNTMFAKCIAAGSCHERTYSPYLWGVELPNGIPYYTEPKYEDFPVIMLDSTEAQAYCNWAGRRLPYEAEWEKAARGQNNHPYPWGAELTCEDARYLGCEKGPAKATDHLSSASPYGVLNMAGNMWEWVADWYDAEYYTQSPAQNPRGPSTGEYRTLRGGGWNSITTQLRVTHRDSGKLEHSIDGAIGIRCALTQAPP